MTATFSGSFNLTALDTGTSHVELTWNDFIPEDYHYEYSVMFTTKFGKDLQNWERHEVMRQSFGAVRKGPNGRLRSANNYTQINRDIRPACSVSSVPAPRKLTPA